jgi:hypothetical protein
MTSQRNNLAAGAAGLLYANGIRFLQVLEGTERPSRTRSSGSRQTLVIMAW